MELSKEFWDTQANRVIVGSDGSLRFTAAGRAHFGPLLARYGYTLEQVTTVETFKSVLEPVLAGELERNTQEMEALLISPDTTEAEQDLLLKILGRTKETLPMRARLRVAK